MGSAEVPLFRQGQQRQTDPEGVRQVLEEHEREGDAHGLETMIFDSDGDGQLDMHEFQAFLNREMDALATDATGGHVPKHRRRRPSAETPPGNLWATVPLSPSDAAGRNRPRAAKCECSMYDNHGSCQHTDKSWTKSSEQQSSAEEKVDPSWAANALKHQAGVESKVDTLLQGLGKSITISTSLFVVLIRQCII